MCAAPSLHVVRQSWGWGGFRLDVQCFAVSNKPGRDWAKSLGALSLQTSGTVAQCLQLEYPPNHKSTADREASKPTTACKLESKLQQTLNVSVEPTEPAILVPEALDANRPDLQQPESSLGLRRQQDHLHWILRGQHCGRRPWGA